MTNRLTRWLAIAAAVALLSVIPGAAAAADLTLTPSEGPPGSLTTASGCGWSTNESVTLIWSAETVLDEAAVDLGGCISHEFHIPENATLGIHEVSAAQNDRSANADFEVKGDVDPRDAGLDALRRKARGEVDIHFVDSFPRSVIADVPIRADTKLARARRYLRTFASLYGQGPPRLRLLPVRQSARGQSPAFVVFQQLVDGVPVLGGQISVLQQGKRVIGTVGTLLVDNPPVGGDPVVLEDNAEDLARDHIGNPSAETVGETHLVITHHEVPIGSDTPGGSGPRLAWSVSLEPNDPHVALVDAVTGGILNAYPLSAHGHRLDLYDAGNQNNAECFIGSAGWPLIGNAQGVFPEYASVPDSFDAVWEAQEAYRLFRNNFGRDSYDNDGTRQRVAIRHTTTGLAAATPCNTLLFNEGAVTRDVYTHEFTHLVTGHTSNLVYSGQSGALNESFSDIMGNLNEFLSSPSDADWLVGEDTNGGAIRNMADPPVGCAGPTGLPCPDTMDSYQSLPNNSANDWGGVHTNSGIHNKTAYLIAEGENFNGINVDRLDDTSKTRHRKLAHLMYAVMTGIPQSHFGSETSGTFRQARDVAVAVSKKWAANGTHGFTAADACTVRNAYAATEIADDTEDLDCDGLLENEDPDNDGDYITDVNDNCPNVPNPSQTNTDGPMSSPGDACDPDDDGDGDPDGDDNCPLVENANQLDTDGNGVGDACQDTDFDSVIDTEDNCPSASNFNQTDSDGDGQGNVCDTDSDGDGVDNAVDNCSSVPNPDQLDSDHGGLGDVCDEDPDDPLNEQLLRLKRLLRKKLDLEPNKLVSIVADFCKAGCPGPWFDSKTNVILTFDGLPARTRAWVSDLDGRMIDQATGRTAKKIVFSPQGLGDYVLNLQLAPNVNPDRTKKIEIKAKLQTP